MKQQPKPTREQLAETWRDASPGFEVNGLGQLAHEEPCAGQGGARGCEEAEAMNCEDCATARTNGMHGIYRAGCLGCQTRGFARSTFAFDAVKTRSSAALRAALDKALPDVPIEDALSAVWDWWRLDHAEESTA